MLPAARGPAARGTAGTAAGRFGVRLVDGGVLLLESSEELISAQEFGWILRSLGERGVLAAIDAVVVATSNESHEPLTLAALDRGLHVTVE